VHDRDRAGIELVLPASTEVIRLVRLLASGIAAQARLDVEDVDDVRIGVDELCSSLLEVSDGNRLTLRFDAEVGGLEVRGIATRRPGAEIDLGRFDLSSEVLAVVVDEHRVELDDEAVSVWIRKRRRSVA
jgi:hypothetical protein